MVGSLLLFTCVKIPKKSTEVVSEEEDQSSWEVIKGTVNLIGTKKMMLLNGELLWSGSSIAYWSAILTPILLLQLEDHDISEKEKQSKALQAMISLGFGEVLGGLIQGQIIDKIGNKAGCMCNCTAVLAATVITVISVNNGEYNYLSYIMCFCWGF